MLYDDELYMLKSNKIYVMLCYVMLCYVMLCYVMLCYLMQTLGENESVSTFLLIPLHTC